MKFLFILLSILITINGISQAGDFIVIRKNGQTIRTFLKGTYVRFITTAGEGIESKIIDVRHDSLFFKEVILQHVPTPWGVARLDTVATRVRGLRYTDIGAIPRAKEGFSYIKNGSILMIGGGGYILLNLINSGYLHSSPFAGKNLPGMIIAAGVFGAGFIIHKLHKPHFKIEKKYTVEYIKLGRATP